MLRKRKIYWYYILKKSSTHYIFKICTSHSRKYRSGLVALSISFVSSSSSSSFLPVFVLLVHWLREDLAMATIAKSTTESTRVKESPEKFAFSRSLEMTFELLEEEESDFGPALGEYNVFYYWFIHWFEVSGSWSLINQCDGQWTSWKLIDVRNFTCKFNKTW